MIQASLRSFLRFFWPTIDPTPTPEQRAAEMSTAYAVTTFINTGTAPALSLGPDHRQDGLSGGRAWRMRDVQQASFDGRHGAAAAGLAAVRRTLAVEIGSAGRREVAHLRMLDVFAAGLEAQREAQRDDATPDQAARDRIAGQACDAADALPDEPYLRHLHARTLYELGRPSEAAKVLDDFAGAAWLGGWQTNFTQTRDYFRSASGRLPQRGTVDARLRAMSEQRDWLELAGTNLTDLLDTEAAAVPRVPLDVAQFRIHVCEAEVSEEIANGLIGSSDDGVALATIWAFRAAIRQRFGVTLPSVNLRTTALPAGDAVAFVDGAVAATASDPRDMAELDGVATWWPGVTDAAPALRVLVVATLRHLPLLARGAPAASREAVEARATMLADRMATTGLPDDQAGGPVLQVAALRLDRITAATLWGNTGRHLPVMLDAGADDALQAAIVPAQGLAVSSDLYIRLAGSLRGRAAADASPFALVVRDPLLRPLLRLLLRDDFPDLPILALAEVDFGNGRVLNVLAVPLASGAEAAR